MRMVSALLVTSAAAATTVSTFPTGICLTDYSKFRINYWWLRSPDTSNDYIAWIVRPSGDVNYYYNHIVTSSYGRFIPPNTNYSRSMCYVGFDGDVIDDYFILSYSYGGICSPDIIGPSYSKNVHRTGIVLGNTNGSVIDSYGVSPSTNRIDLTCFSGPDGVVGNYHYGSGLGGYINYSYGVDIAEHT